MLITSTRETVDVPLSTAWELARSGEHCLLSACIRDSRKGQEPRQIRGIAISRYLASTGPKYRKNPQESAVGDDSEEHNLNRVYLSEGSKDRGSIAVEIGMPNYTLLRYDRESQAKMKLEQR